MRDKESELCEHVDQKILSALNYRPYYMLLVRKRKRAIHQRASTLVERQTRTSRTLNLKIASRQWAGGCVQREAALRHTDRRRPWWKANPDANQVVKHKRPINSPTFYSENSRESLFTRLSTQHDNLLRGCSAGPSTSAENVYLNYSASALSGGDRPSQR